jgi:UDP-GlcNAc:undecaprenyl-phosphate GlcNAc-1-phosphate transferase
MTLSLFKISLLLIGAFVLTYVVIPKIIGVAHFKRLMDQPNARSSHTNITPTLGGIAFYISIMLSFYFLDSEDQFNIIPSLLPGLTILFIMGLKDDLTVLSVYKKFFAQILASLFLLAHPKFEIYTLHGFMGITHLNSISSGIIALFLMVAIINAYNLIDGIDGLAGIIGLIIFILFAGFFFISKSNLSFGLCLVMIGTLAAFLRYNLSSTKKIFMGDTGSLLVGFVIAAMTIRLLSLPSEGLVAVPFRAENIPFIAASILIIPLFDMTRVFIIRIAQGKGPFSPDRNHVHHVLIDQLGMSHAKASVFLATYNLLFMAVFFYFCSNLSVYAVAALFVFVLLLMALFLEAITHGKILTKLKKIPIG